MAQNVRTTYAKTFLALNQAGKNIVRISKKNLSTVKTRKVASGRRVTSKIDNTGKLSQSITSTATKNGVFVEMDFYGKYVDEGRKPGKYAPVDAIQKWVQTKGIKPRDSKGRFMRRTPTTMKSLSFLLNRSIYRHGILPTNFFSDPLEQELRLLDKKLPNLITQDLDSYFSRNNQTTTTGLIKR